MAKKDRHLKVKRFEVSSRSYFGRPSEMDKTIQRWENKGWAVREKRKLRGNDKYNLTLEYRMSDEELAAERKRRRNVGIGCFGVIAVLFVLSTISASQRATNLAASQTLAAQLQGTEVAQKHVTNTQQSFNDTATATLWTPTDTPTTSDTPTITPTPSITYTPSITPTPSDTPTITDTVPIPTETPPPPTDAPAETYYVQREANARACPQRDCEIVTVFSAGATVSVVGWEQGDVVSGSDIWRIVSHNGQQAFIHSSLIAVSPPRPTIVPQQEQQVPQQQAISTPPLAPQSQAGFTCSCSRTCTRDILTCEEAYFQLNQCGCSERDSDDDGVPCENLCPGG